MIPMYFYSIKMIEILIVRQTCIYRNQEPGLKLINLHLIWIIRVIVFFPIRATDCLSLTLDGIIFKKVPTCKYLGIRFDDQLTWRNHSDYIYNKLKQLTGIFFGLRSMLAYIGG